MDINKKVISRGDIVKTVAYCGVLHLYNLEWESNSKHVWVRGDCSVTSCTAALYLEPIPEILKKKGDRNVTHHKFMMEELGFWDSFEGLKGRACDIEGKFKKDFRVEKENELFYGFTRKYSAWYGTSCTLNSWINRVFCVPQVVREAGKKGTDKVKEGLINTVPQFLWLKILPWLQELISLETESWNLEWAKSAESRSQEKKAFKEDQLSRMRCLVLEGAVGSELYWLDLQGKEIGKGGPSAVEALATVLLEKVNKVPRCSLLQTLKIRGNSLTSDDMMILAPMLTKCVKLEHLCLGWNDVGNNGCVTWIRSLPNTLDALSLTYNRLGDEVCEELGRLLPTNLNQLVLTHNQFGSAGCSKLLELYERPNNKLILLWIGGNPGATKEVKRRILDIIPAVYHEVYKDLGALMNDSDSLKVNGDQVSDVLESGEDVASRIELSSQSDLVFPPMDEKEAIAVTYIQQSSSENEMSLELSSAHSENNETMIDGTSNTSCTTCCKVM